MNIDKQKQIVATWNAIEELDPEISTERLISMTADQEECDVSDVVKALSKQAMPGSVKE